MYAKVKERKSDAKRFYIANKLGTMTAYIYKKTIYITNVKCRFTVKNWLQQHKIE